MMVTPILMLLLTLTLDQPVNRWVNIIVAIFWFGFNLIALPTYPGLYDRFLIVVGLIFNVRPSGMRGGGSESAHRFKEGDDESDCLHRIWFARCAASRGGDATPAPRRTSFWCA
jgi:hypothetical protein